MAIKKVENTHAYELGREIRMNPDLRLSVIMQFFPLESNKVAYDRPIAYVTNSNKDTDEWLTQLDISVDGIVMALKGYAEAQEYPKNEKSVDEYYACFHDIMKTCEDERMELIREYEPVNESKAYELGKKMYAEKKMIFIMTRQDQKDRIILDARSAGESFRTIKVDLGGAFLFVDGFVSDMQ